MARYYNRYNQDRFTLNTAGYSPTVFNPIEFKPVETDLSILNKAMLLQEERQKEAVEQTSTIKSALGKVREELHRDPETLAWFDAKANEIENNLNIAAQVGDYAGVINLAKQEAGNLASDAELTARIRNNKEYEARMQELDNMVSQGYIYNSTANYIKKTNPYSNKFVKDDNGNIIGSEEWNFSKKPVKDLNINQLFEQSFKSIQPDIKSSQKQTNLVSGNVAEYSRAGAYSNITEQHSSTKRKVSPSEIITQAQNILFSNPDWEQQLEQLYGGAWQTYQDNEAKLASMDEKVKLGSMDKNDLEYKQLSTIVNMQRQLFYTDGISDKKDVNTFLNYFNKQLFMSEQAKAYGYTIEDYNNSYSATNPNAGSSTVKSALDDELNNRSQNQAKVRLTFGSHEVSLW